eukprot:4001179-Pleurochrysis_carterae.AAC.1
MPAFSSSSSDAAPSSANQPLCALPPCRSIATSSPARLHPRDAPVAGRDTAYPPRSSGFSSGNACA